MAVVGRVALFIISCAVLVAVAAPFGTKLPGHWPEVVIGTIAALAALALTALFVRWEKLRMDDIGAAPDARSPVRLAIGFAAGLILVAVWALMEVAAGQMRWVRDPGLELGAGAIVLMGYLALSCREELAFHGYPLRRLQSRFGIWPAQLMVAAAFAIEHRLGGWPGPTPFSEPLSDRSSSAWPRSRPTAWRCRSVCTQRGTSVNGRLGSEDQPESGNRASRNGTISSESRSMSPFSERQRLRLPYGTADPSALLSFPEWRRSRSTREPPPRSASRPRCSTAFSCACT
jgi:membrane protease YdiL (CAAX protease family)